MKIFILSNQNECPLACQSVLRRPLPQALANSTLQHFNPLTLLTPPAFPQNVTKARTPTTVAVARVFASAGLKITCASGCTENHGVITAW